MPLTPLHLGPALVLGLLLRRRLHLPTLLLASIVIDFEPLLVLILRLDHPLHGYLHTLLFAIPCGVAIGYAMMRMEKLFNSLHKALLLEEAKPMCRKSFLLAGLIGVSSHVLLDSPLYRDIRPLYPLEANPLYSPSLALPIYLFCACTLLVGFIMYVSLLVVATVRR
uniref:Hydrolase n=1 Tax=Ignisphaera aggregans TaxID=334771 RepID=A0A7C4FGD5_9CREN